MNYKEKIEEILNNQNGTILSSDCDLNNIPRIYLQKMVEDNELERTSRGVYVSVHDIEDEMFALQRKYSKLIFSHETALFLHDLSDRTPLNYAVTVPSSYKVVQALSNKCKIYYIKKENQELGAENVLSPMGNEVITYNIERTICDCVRSRNRIEAEILSNALKLYIQLPTADINILMEYARKLRVESILRIYLEVIIK